MDLVVQKIRCTVKTLPIYRWYAGARYVALWGLLFGARKPTPSVSALSIVYQSSLTFHIFDFFSATAKQNSTKLNRKQYLCVIQKVCVLRVDWKTNMTVFASDAWDILDFSATTQLNSTKLNRTKVLGVLYQVCVFLVDRKTKMTVLVSDWRGHSRLLLCNRWTEFNEAEQETSTGRPLPSLCLSGRSENKDGRPAFWLAGTFSTSSLLPLDRIQPTGHGTSTQRPLPSLCFSGRSENRNGRLGFWYTDTF